MVALRRRLPEGRNVLIESSDREPNSLASAEDRRYSQCLPSCFETKP